MEHNDQPYRHELKYLLSSAQSAALSVRLRGLLQRDPHAGAEGRYTIRSMYFDDLADSGYFANENGTDPREKLRIRIYNASAERISLECKRKERGKTLKTACRLTEEETRRLMRGELLECDGTRPLLQKLNILMRTQGLRPTVLVEYEREPFVYRDGNVRITFDRKLASSPDIAGFFDRDIPRRPVLPVGRELLEVKFDAFLPDVIYRTLQSEMLAQTAFSKYYLCRKYMLR